MADRYVRSTDGSDADSGATWALAKATGAGAAAIDTAGDRIFFSDVHAESTAASITWSWAGTAASPTRLICGDDAAEPPTAVAETGSVTTTGNSNIIVFNTGSGYCYGLSFIAGSGASGTANILCNNGSNVHVQYESCNFTLGSTGTGSAIFIGGTSAGLTEFRNCGFKFSATAQNLTVGSISNIRINGGSILSGGSAITRLLTMSGPGEVLIGGFDFSNIAATANIGDSANVNVFVLLRNCKMPASWSGSIHSGTPGSGSIWEICNCDSADTNYRLERKTHLGTVTHETTIVATGGASDGTTPISWKMVSNADAEFPHQTLDSPEIFSEWIESVGSAKTITIEIVHDSVTNITDAEIWVEVQYLGTSGTPLSLFVDDAAADILATAADQADSSAAWTTTGMTNPNTQKLNVSFTPQEKGIAHCVVKLAMASKTVYVNPKATIT